ncbi:lysophospholipid acyltransferase family protein [Salidesulfovibrio onnuriiensis]|uniref:lysophospholipid acyltransferase family protein n=1 Tax=Salidesulfovibrio onnuriiensis TaxID=2583823 RepID=UPI0011CB6404|nr:lysophospholipid acyltransferase family protein [Salidesulfovibrio onnuriiensis]
MSTLRLIITNIVMYAGTISLTLCCVLISVPFYCCLRLTGKYTRTTAVRRMIWLYGRAWVSIANLLMEVDKPKTGSVDAPCVMVLNHASFFDSYCIGFQPQWNFSFAVRNWPFKIPLYGPFMRTAQYVATEDADMETVLEQSTRVIREGGIMVFYPEGTRSKNGELGRFYSGAFLTAIKANVPVVPVCLSGTGKMLKRGGWLVRPHPLRMRILPPVHPDAYRNRPDGHMAMRKDVKKQMAEALKHMETTSDIRVDETKELQCDATH